MTKLLEALFGSEEVKALFQNSSPDHCLVVLWRHFPHNKNMTVRKWLRLARQFGQALKGNIEIGAACASPEPRAQQHLMEFMFGLGEMVQLRTYDALCALNSEGSEAITKVLAESEAAGMGPEEFILNDPIYAKMRSRRGIEGAQCVLEVAAENLGKVVLVGSHGGSRLEPTIAALAKREQQNYDYIMPMGSMCLMLIDKSGNVADETYIVIQEDDDND